MSNCPVYHLNSVFRIFFVYFWQNFNIEEWKPHLCDLKRFRVILVQLKFNFRDNRMQKQRSSVRNRPKCVNGVSNGSMLLVDYRMDRYPNLQLSDIISHVYEFATDYKGSKFVQRKLDEATGARKDAIFREMRPQLLNLMMNTFGNFIVQKFFDVGSVEHRNEITKLVREHFMELSLDKYGCRVVQTVIEKAPPNLQPYIFHSHEDRDIVLLVKDSNGNHVIQKSFRCVNTFIQVSSWFDWDFSDANRLNDAHLVFWIHFRIFFSTNSMVKSLVCAWICTDAVSFNAFWSKALCIIDSPFSMKFTKTRCDSSKTVTAIMSFNMPFVCIFQPSCWFSKEIAFRSVFSSHFDIFDISYTVWRVLRNSGHQPIDRKNREQYNFTVATKVRVERRWKMLEPRVQANASVCNDSFEQPR